MVTDEMSEYKDLIFSIFKQAIYDATCVKKPKNIKKIKLLGKTEKFDIRKVLTFGVKNFSYCEKNQPLLSISILFMVDKILNHIDKDPACDHDECKNDNRKSKYLECKHIKDIRAQDAREFLSDKNDAFCMYCDYLGFDPAYTSEKINNEIRKFDLGRKRILLKYRNFFDFCKNAA